MSFNPERVSYDKSDIQRESANTTLSDGWYKFVINATTIKDDPSGNVVANNRVNALDPEDGETRKGPQMYQRITLPLRNPDREDHVPPDYAKGIAREFLRALDPDEIPDVPRRVDGNWQYQGEEIDADEVEEKKEEATEKLLDACTKWCKNANLFKDYTFYGKVVTTEKDGNVYTNIKSVRAELPDGETLVEASAFVTRQAPKKTNGTNGHGTNGTTQHTGTKTKVTTKKK